MAIGGPADARRQPSKNHAGYQMSNGYGLFSAQLPLASASAPASTDQVQTFSAGLLGLKTETSRLSDSPKASGTTCTCAAKAGKGTTSNQDVHARPGEFLLVPCDSDDSKDASPRKCKVVRVRRDSEDSEANWEYEIPCPPGFKHASELHVLRPLSLRTEFGALKSGIPTTSRLQAAHASQRTSVSPTESVHPGGFQSDAIHPHLDRSRKRQSAFADRYEEPDELDGDYAKPFAVAETVTFRLANVEKVQEYFKDVLTQVQQLSLKDTLKNWIKFIEPKKQKKYSYNKGKKPPWWPEGCKYKEPDHIKIHDRLLLAMSMIRWVMTAPQFHGKGLQGLEEIVNRLVHVFDGEPPEKGEHRQKLYGNLFHLAKAQLAVLNGERDASDFITLPKVQKYEKPKPNKAKKVKKARHDNEDAGDGEGESFGRADEASTAVTATTRSGSAADEMEIATVPSSPRWFPSAHRQSFDACVPASTHIDYHPRHQATSFDSGMSCSPSMAHFPTSRSADGMMAQHMDMTYTTAPPQAHSIPSPGHGLSPQGFPQGIQQAVPQQSHMVSTHGHDISPQGHGMLSQSHRPLHEGHGLASPSHGMSSHSLGGPPQLHDLPRSAHSMPVRSHSLPDYRSLMMDTAMMTGPEVSQPMHQMPMIFSTFTDDFDRHWAPTCAPGNPVQQPQGQMPYGTSYYM